MRAWFLLSVGLASTGLALFLYKVLGLGYPLTTADQPGTWRVDLVINAAGRGGRITIDAPLPRSDAYQRLISEEVRSGPLRFSIEETDGERRARWSGRVEGPIHVSYHVTLQALPYRRPLPEADSAPVTYSKSVAVYLEASPLVQKDDPAIADLSREIMLDRTTDRVKLVRAIYEFIRDEIGPFSSASPMDALAVLREGRGTVAGRARLFCALARANRLPCRVVGGLVLGERASERMHYWNEVYIGEHWVPFDAAKGFAESLPGNRAVFSAPDGGLIEGSGASSLSHRFYVEAELETYAELVRRRIAASQHLLDRYSLLHLPVHAQRSLRFLLLIPLGALAMCITRNIIGIRTFGTFMPMLIALAMTATGLLWGSAMLVAIIGGALLTRLSIQRLYLLFAPRIAFILSVVVLLMVAVMLLGDRLQLPTSGVDAFPFVIMTMIVERISVSLEEEGWRNTLNRIVSTVFSIYLTYAFIQARVLQAFFLVFPELLLIILGMLVVVGRYTGYRLSELVRFRELVAAQAAVEAATPKRSEARHFSG